MYQALQVFIHHEKQAGQYFQRTSLFRILTCFTFKEYVFKRKKTLHTTYKFSKIFYE